MSHRVTLRHAEPPVVLCVAACLECASSSTAAMAVALRPAHETKHLPLLVYPFRHHVFHLAQRDDGATNGTGLWLGAQCLSLYLSDALKSRPSSSSAASGSPPPRAIELGSGIGLSACVSINAISSGFCKHLCCCPTLQPCSRVYGLGRDCHRS